MSRQPIIGERHEHRFEDLDSLLVWVKPSVKAFRVEDDWHSVVNRLDNSVGQDGDG
jgi:hypothetical protein